MREHVTSQKLYFLVGVALLALLALTVAAASIDLGPWNTVVALTIAACKALLVILFFMHVRYSSRVIWVYALIGFFWLILFFSLTFGDYLTRGWLPGT
jgi:cytochrome c oxidase subunit IV